ncbi:Hypothetical protein A7982_10180 [Minicystis rosea]|nr:Hypothetical protein A7982_10180 [Minicystis rosea]
MKRSTTSASALMIAALLLGCGGGEMLNPSPTGGTDAGPIEDAGSGGSGGGAEDAGAPKRTVMQRNPFGNVAERENLLWDGDFEWYSAFSDQYGWLAGGSTATLGFGFTDVTLGAECRSGIRCAKLAKKRVIAGLAVASEGNKLEVSFWAHVTQGPCSKVGATLIEFSTDLDPNVALHPVAADPDAEGWCRFDSIVDARKGKPVLMIQNNTAGDLIIDDAVIKKVPSAMSVKAYHGPLTAEADAEVAAARESLRKLRGPHDPPPNEVRRALERRRQP